MTITRGYFKSEIRAYGGKRRAVLLTWKKNRYAREHYAVWLIVNHELRSFGTERLPFAYQYLESTLERANPVITIVAGPGVSILRGGSGTVFPPRLDIIRVQDPELIPPMGADLTTINFTSSYVVGGLESKYGPMESVVGKFPENYFVVDRLRDELVIQHKASNSQITISVEPFAYRHTGFSDSDHRFTIHIDPDGKWEERSLLKILKTPPVKVVYAPDSLLPITYSTEHLFSDNKDGGIPYYSVYEVDDINDIPPPGVPLELTSRWRPVSADYKPTTGEFLTKAAVDIVVGFLPVAGDLIDLAEAAFGEDKFGRPLSDTERALAGLGAIVPFVSGPLIRKGSILFRKTANLFRSRTGKAIDLIESFRKSGLTLEEAKLVRDIEKAILKGGDEAVALFIKLRPLLERVKLKIGVVSDLLNAAEEGFIHADLQELYQAYRAKKLKEFEKLGVDKEPSKPFEWAVHQGHGRAKRILDALLGAGFAKRSNELRRKLHDLNLLSIALPDGLTEKRAVDTAHELIHKYRNQLTERLEKVVEGPDPDVLYLPGVVKRLRVNSGDFANMKGNVGEALSMDVVQQKVLERFNKGGRVSIGPGLSLVLKPGEAKIYSGIRMRLMKDGPPSAALQFTDNIIAVKRGGSLFVLAVFEVKSGFRGGYDARIQVFRWIEDRITKGSELVLSPATVKKKSRILSLKEAGSGESKLFAREISKEESFVYNPDSRAKGRVIGLLAAERHIITTEGVSHLGINSSSRIAPDTIPHELPGWDSKAIDYLTAKILSII